MKPGDTVQHSHIEGVGTIVHNRPRFATVRFDGVLYQCLYENLTRVRRNFTPDQIEAMYDALVQINHPLIGDLKK